MSAPTLIPTYGAREPPSRFTPPINFYPQPRTTAVTSSFEQCAFTFLEHSLRFGDIRAMYLGWVTAKNAQFLSLQSAVFCAECELISENTTPYCLACGSKAMLSLSRVLGGSLRGKETAHVIRDAELDRLVRDLLRTVPDPVIICELWACRKLRACAAKPPKPNPRFIPLSSIWSPASISLPSAP